MPSVLRASAPRSFSNLCALLIAFASAFTGIIAQAATESSAAPSEMTEANTLVQDSRWLQFNLMKSIDNKIPFGNQQDTYLEMEFGGRSGFFDLYGYLDIFDILDTPQSNRHNGDNFFFKFAPRLSLNALTGKNLSVGAFKEFYIAGLMNVGDKALLEQYLGIGSDVEVPWFGKVGANLMARYVRENFGAANEHTWDGYLLSTNWFKPFIFLDKNFITYQGYLDFKFTANRIADANDHANNSLEWFNGFYWHSPRYAVGYGLKYYKDMALFKNGGIAGETTGWGHYIALTCKF